MDANYSSLQTPQFRVLSDRQIERVYQATLECLNRTGVDVHNAEARELLGGAGARVDGVRVRIPPHIIQDAIAATPRTFTIWGATVSTGCRSCWTKSTTAPAPPAPISWTRRRASGA